MSYLSVSDVDSSYKAALAAGAKSLMAPTDYGSAGRAATIADPTGGVFSLWRGAQGDPAETKTTPPGSWIWNELSTRTRRWRSRSTKRCSASATTRCHARRHLLHPQAGREGPRRPVPRHDASQPTLWMPYVCVADCDAVAEQARALGATLHVPATDIPGVGRFAMFTDPQGASLSILKPLPSMA